MEEIKISALMDECHRLAESPRFRGEPMALEAIQAVLCWAEEESVE